MFGHVDEITRDGIRGWFLDLGQPEVRQTVSAILNGELVGYATCDNRRTDITALVGFSVNCGFHIRWDWSRIRIALEKLGQSGQCVVEVRAPDGTIIACKNRLIEIQLLREWGSALPLAPSKNKISACELVQYMAGVDGQKVEPRARQGEVKLIAYYLPQFHPIPENDEWWGPGFTEWTNVAHGSPYFQGHYQPHVPGELGFYDLRSAEVREAQADLAREHGIYGFCYYYYWFSGRRLLERPLQEVLASGRPDFPFCICWANENWSRRWDGSENEVLVHQIHDQTTDEAFIRDVIPLFRDTRYIRINGAPLLIIYRLSLLPTPVETAATWRRICAEEGIPKIHLCMTETFGQTDPYSYGFDSAVQFPPHGVLASERNSDVKDLANNFTGKLYSMRDVVANEMVRDIPTYKRFPGVMTSWDNTSRKKIAGNVFIESSPQTFELWLRHAVGLARDTLPPGEQLVFINAWNEWAEGAHLEPDRRHGRAYLEATRRAISGRSDWNLTVAHAMQLSELAGETKKNTLRDLSLEIERLSLVNSHLLQIMGEHGLPKLWVRAKPGHPSWMEGISEINRGVCRLDQVNYYMHPMPRQLTVDSASKLYIVGWSFCDPVILTRDTPTYLLLRSKLGGKCEYFAPIVQRYPREDVSASHRQTKKDYSHYSGFRFSVDISGVKEGTYNLYISYRGTGNTYVTDAGAEIEIL